MKIGNILCWALGYKQGWGEMGRWKKSQPQHLEAQRSQCWHRHKNGRGGLRYCLKCCTRQSTRPLVSHRQQADTELCVSSKDVIQWPTSWLKGKLTVFLCHLEEKHAIWTWRDWGRLPLTGEKPVILLKHFAWKSRMGKMGCVTPSLWSFPGWRLSQLGSSAPLTRGLSNTHPRPFSPHSLVKRSVQASLLIALGLWSPSWRC